MHTHTHMLWETCAHAHMHAHTHMHACMHTHMHTHTQTHAHAHTHNVHTHTQCKHTHNVNTHTHTQCTHTQTMHVCTPTVTHKNNVHTHTMYTQQHPHTHTNNVHTHTHTHTPSQYIYPTTTTTTTPTSPHSLSLSSRCSLKQQRKHQGSCQRNKKRKDMESHSVAMELGSGGVIRRGFDTVLDPEFTVGVAPGLPPFARPGDVWFPLAGLPPFAAAFWKQVGASLLLLDLGATSSVWSRQRSGTCLCSPQLKESWQHSALDWPHVTWAPQHTP